MILPPNKDWIQQAYIEEQQKKIKPPKLQPSDYYWEDGKMVMTESYHLKRGYCCKSQCRHCPYTDWTNQVSK